MSYRIESHPAATLFPLMDGIELKALADDITAHGLLEPIVMLDGRVLDGRNRLRACELSGVTPLFVEWVQNGSSPTEWVVSHNLHRRHLTVAQRAALALDLLPRLEAEARERMAEGGREYGRGKGSPETDTPIAEGRADEKAAAMVGIGRSSVATAKAIQNRDDSGAVVQAMRSGEVNVQQAAREVGLKTSGQSSTILDSGERTAHGHAKPVYFGKGDKWLEATQPLARYLKAFEKRDYEFSHVNPREATKRLQVIDELIESLQAARVDLETRSHKARGFGFSAF